MGARADAPRHTPVLLAVIAKHVSVDPDKVEIKLERGKVVSVLEIDIEVPTAAGAKPALPADAEKAA